MRQPINDVYDDFSRLFSVFQSFSSMILCFIGKYDSDRFLLSSDDALIE